MASNEKTTAATRLKNSMPTLAQPTAELWNTIFNFMLVSGAILVLAGTWGAFWTGNMKEFYSNARISANEAQTASANAEAGRANEAAASALERATKTELALEQERVQRLELQKQVQGRHLTEEQRSQIQSYLREHPIATHVLVWAPKGDNEALFYAAEIVDCLNAAGVVTGGPHTPYERAFGLSILPNSNSQKGVIAEALASAGIKLRDDVQSDMQGEPSTVYLVVGSKIPD